MFDETVAGGKIMYNFSKTEKIVGGGILAAIVIILQLLSTFGFHMGSVPISLVLIPIAIGAILYGPLMGAFLGGVFGIVVIAMILGGLDPVSMTMMQFNAICTILTCLLKGILSGLVCGLVYKAFSKINQRTIGTVIGTLLCPIINTGFYVLMVVFVFRELMEKILKVKGGKAVFTALMGLISVNVISEIVITVVFTPIVIRIIKIVMSSRKGN